MSEKVKKQSPFRTPGEETVSSPGASSSIYEEVAIRLSLEAWLFLLDGEKACSTEREHCDVCSWVTGVENCKNKSNEICNQEVHYHYQAETVLEFIKHFDLYNTSSEESLEIIQ